MVKSWPCDTKAVVLTNKVEVDWLRRQTQNFQADRVAFSSATKKAGPSNPGGPFFLCSCLFALVRQKNRIVNGRLTYLLALFDGLVKSTL